MHEQRDVPPSEACGGSEAHRPRFMRAIPCFVSHHVEPLQLALAQVFLDRWSSRGESDRTLLDATPQNSTARSGCCTVFWGRRMQEPQRKRACCVRAARALVVLRARKWDHFATTPTGVRLHLRHHGRCCRARTSGCAGDGRGRRPSFRVRGRDVNGAQEGCMRRDELTW